MADLDAIAQRPAEYLAETGVPQLSGGLIFFSLGSSILIQRLLPRTPLYMLAVPYTGTCCAIRRAVGESWRSSAKWSSRAAAMSCLSVARSDRCIYVWLCCSLLRYGLSYAPLQGIDSISWKADWSGRALR